MHISAGEGLMHGNSTNLHIGDAIVTRVMERIPLLERYDFWLVSGIA